MGACLRQAQGAAAGAGEDRRRDRAGAQSALEREITTEQVGEMVMKRLKDVDEVAYVRFASVYRQFKDIDTFMQELTKLLNDRG